MIGIIPAAGLGTRLKNISRGKPKELLPIQGKPMIEWVVLEALKSGLSKIIIVISPEKKELQEYLSKFPKITFIYQPVPYGLADAIYRCKEIVGESKFAVLLPDNIFIGKPPITRLLQVAESYQKNVISLIEVTRSQAPYFGNCGKIEVIPINSTLFELTKLSDKGAGFFSTNGKPMVLRTFPRHIFFPEIFEYIDKSRPIHLRLRHITDKGELDDVPVLQAIISERKFLGVLAKGKAFDVGHPKGYKNANVKIKNQNDKSKFI
ncbi:NTP transferase domain-containing protein [candidate division WOR-3 bacterium]|nr:NTP transferase domain-containing protein [candidate division WOR-3 bacterium]